MEVTIYSLASQPRTIVRPPPDLEQVFARYVDPMYRFLYSRVGNREDAEELTSEVFLRASRQLDAARADASVAAWLFRLARKVLADHWRRYYRAEASARISNDDLRAMSGESRSGARSEQMTRRVAAVLETLPDRYRRVLELRFLFGYSISETAQEMGTTPENVKVIQHRALARAAQAGEELL